MLDSAKVIIFWPFGSNLKFPLRDFLSILLKWIFLISPKENSFQFYLNFLELQKDNFFSLNLIEEKNITEIKFLLTLQLESFIEEKFFLAIMREIFFQLYVAKFLSVQLKETLFSIYR